MIKKIVSFLTVLLVLSLALASFVWLSGTRGAQAATLMDTSGQVEVLQGDGSWAVLAEGDRVASGQRLRTGPASRATLVFFDGTRTTLASNSDVTLTQVNGGWGGELRVSLTQNAGRTAHSVVPLRGDRSAFTVLTPTGAASVHGTNFDVAVDAQGRSRYGVNTGRVLVSSEADEVFLTAGQATTTQTDGALEDPAYQFTLQGTLSSMEGSTWIVEGVPFTVLSETELSGDPQVGSQVTVVGRVLASGGDLTASDHAVRLFDRNSRKELGRFDGHTATVTCLAFSPDGKFALSGSEDRTVRYWRLPE